MYFPAHSGSYYIPSVNDVSPSSSSFNGFSGIVFFYLFASSFSIYLIRCYNPFLKNNHETDPKTEYPRVDTLISLHRIYPVQKYQSHGDDFLKIN